MSGESFNRRTNQLRQIMRFEVVDGPRAGEVLNIPLPEPGEAPVLIGRSRECAIWIDAQNISRRHTEILSSPDRRPLVRDLGSVNGTLVNNQSVSQTTPLPLNAGDHIRLGLSELVFTGLSAPVSQPAPAPVITSPAPMSGLPAFSSPGPITLGGGPEGQPGLVPRSSSAVPARAATLPGDYYIYLAMRDGQRYLLEGEEVTVGRGQANDIVIDSNSISRQHARLQRTVAGVFVNDLGSTNKTFVNGVQADGPVLLRDGDVVRFGDVEADFKLEGQRLTTMHRMAGPLPGGYESGLPEVNPADITQKDVSGNDQTFVAALSDQTFVGDFGRPTAAQKRSLEQSETALDLDIRVVGRALRQSTDLVPEVSRKQTTGGRLTEVARLEGVHLSEGIGRGIDVLLNNVRLGLKPGELVALVGPSGSGKTELLQVMAGLRPADRGQVTVLGRSLPTMESNGGQRPNFDTDRDLARWRLHSVGYLPGEPELNPRLSALEQVMWGLEQAGFGRDPRERMEKATEQLQRVGLGDPEIIRLRPADLNRTERKLVALARALALDPPLLLADEPTGRIPSASADRVFSLLKELTSGDQTVFMVTSDLLWARNTDRQIEILDGAIVGSLS